MHGLAYNNRAYEKALIGQLDSGLEDANHAVRLMPKHPNPTGTRGTIYYLKERYAEAIKDFQHSRHLQAEHYFAMVGLIASYHRLGGEVNTEEAVRLWHKLIAVNPRFQELTYLNKKLLIPPQLLSEIALLKDTLTSE